MWLFAAFTYVATVAHVSQTFRLVVACITIFHFWSRFSISDVNAVIFHLAFHPHVESGGLNMNT
jgi:hypothetical protein